MQTLFIGIHGLMSIEDKITNLCMKHIDISIGRRGLRSIED